MRQIGFIDLRAHGVFQASTFKAIRLILLMIGL